jgi:hypothetical protein
MVDLKEEKKDNKKKNTKTVIILTCIGDIFRLLIWYCYFNNKFHWGLYCYNLDFYISRLFVNIWKAIGLSLVILILALCIQKRGFWKSFALSIGYIIRFFWRLFVFPLRVVSIIIRLFVYPLSIMGKLIRLHRRIETLLLSACFYFYGLSNIIHSNERALLQCSLFFIFFFLFCIWEWLYLWSKDPYWWIYGINLPNIFDNIWRFVETKFITEDLAAAKENTKKAIQVKKNIWQGFKFLNGCKNKFNPSYDRKRLLEQFLIVLLIVALINVISFGFSFHAIYKLNPNSITGIGNNIWEFLYFSTITFFNFGIGSYALAGVGARIMLILELFSFLFLLTVTILTFSTLSEEGARQTIEFVQGKIEDKKRSLSKVLLENFKLSEDELLQYKESDFKEAVETKSKIEVIESAHVIEAVTVQKAENEEIEKRILLLKSSNTWDEASRNVRFILELEEQFTQADILRIVDVILSNDQILSSYAARPFIKNFFAKNSRFIPKEKFEEFFNLIG